MKQNYRLTIAYDGSRYYGWEHQPGTDLTIQGKLENVLALMVGEPVEVIGAGRTDAGVHAKAMTANAFLNTELSEEEIRGYLNRYLPDDICVSEVRRAGDRFHSRYNALGKTYVYTCYVGVSKPVFDRKYVYALEEMPDVESMRRAAEYLKGEKDFASFCSNPRMKKSTVREVDQIDIRQKGDYLTFTYHGTGFFAAYGADFDGHSAGGGIRQAYAGEHGRADTGEKARAGRTYGPRTGTLYDKGGLPLMQERRDRGARPEYRRRI